MNALLIVLEYPYLAFGIVDERVIVLEYPT